MMEMSAVEIFVYYMATVIFLLALCMTCPNE